MQTKPNQTLSAGTPVVNQATDYTQGRPGVVLELDATGRRARVLWTHEGPKLNSVPLNRKGWIKVALLKPAN